MKAYPKICDLSAALMRMGGNGELLRQVARFYREDSPTLLDRLKAAVRRNDLAELRHAAHSLKGLVVNFDADAASQAAQQIEQMAQAGDLTQADETIAELESALDQLGGELAMGLDKL